MTEFGSIAVKIDGSVSMTQRQQAVDEFQTNENIRLFVGNIKAAGVGITLTASSNVVFLELPWTPGELSQAEDRCHRIGQEYTVNAHYLLATETIEDRIIHILDAKRKVLDAVLDGKITEQDSLLTELINSYLKENGKKM
jgi:SWI/SNF-related matrix-associated actin-dependent regulator 1 of chromatin subfamily A